MTDCLTRESPKLIYNLGESHFVYCVYFFVSFKLFQVHRNGNETRHSSSIQTQERKSKMLEVQYSEDTFQCKYLVFQDCGIL